MTDSQRQGGESTGPPLYESTAVSRVASRVQIVNVELVGAHYERLDDGLEVTAFSRELVPEFRVGLEWGLSDSVLLVVATFATAFDEEDDQPYSIVGRFRLSYEVSGETVLDDEDVTQFVHWNAMFNAWPYWREFVSNYLDRGQLPRFVVPVMGVPAVRSVDQARL